MKDTFRNGNFLLNAHAYNLLESIRIAVFKRSLITISDARGTEISFGIAIFLDLDYGN